MSIKYLTGWWCITQHNLGHEGSRQSGDEGNEGDKPLHVVWLVFEIETGEGSVVMMNDCEWQLDEDQSGDMDQVIYPLLRLQRT
jgi:hypothetical protein